MAKNVCVSVSTDPVKNFQSIVEYAKKIEAVTKKQIVALAKRVRIDTVYFLRSGKEGEVYENN